jgi:hypothetical protein
VSGATPLMLFSAADLGVEDALNREDSAPPFTFGD